MEFTVSDQIDEQRISNLKLFMSKQKQFYPNYKEWLNEKCIPRVMSEVYKVVFARDRDDFIGNLVYRENTDFIEIKNFRIDEGYRNLYLGSMLLKMIGKKKVITDISCNNFSAVSFFLKSGFNIVSMKELYKENQFEYIIQKSLTQ